VRQRHPAISQASFIQKSPFQKTSQKSGQPAAPIPPFPVTAHFLKSVHEAGRGGMNNETRNDPYENYTLDQSTPHCGTIDHRTVRNPSRFPASRRHLRQPADGHRTGQEHLCWPLVLAGLPDAWETAHGLSAADATDASLDLDGDGHSNLAEYRSGTSPTDAASCLKLEGITQSNGTATVSFNAASNQTYTVEWCADLGGAWTKLTDVLARPTGRMESVVDSNGSEHCRFYRVVTPRRP